MGYWELGSFGAAGGALVEVLAVFTCLLAWQTARRTPRGRTRAKPPKLSLYVDLPAHAILLVLRTGMGAFAAIVVGAGGGVAASYVAVALGFAAPSALKQLAASVPQMEAAIAGPQVRPDGDELMSPAEQR